MIALAPLAVVVVWLVAAEVVARVPDPGSARRVATWCAAAAVGLSLLSIALPTERVADVVGLAVSPGAGAQACTAISLAGLLIAAMSPLATHIPAVLARALRLVAVSCALLAVRHNGFDAALIAVSTWLTWSGLRGRSDGLDRLFALYQVPAVVLFLVGAVMPGLAGEIALLLGAAIRLAIIPAHAWFPRFVDRAPIGIVVAYLSTPVILLSPTGNTSAVIGVLSVAIAAIFAVVQTDAHRALAYLVIAANGLALAGAAWPTALVATAGLAMTTGVLAARRGTLSYTTPSGDLSNTPRLAVAYVLFALALAGFPLLPGFADDHALLAEIALPLALIAVLAMAVNGMTALRGFLGLFTRLRTPTGERDLTRLENCAVAITLATLVICGVVPGITSSAAQPVSTHR
ncbi:hypothetical protein [Actinokineospora sp. NBRC 105648]|uniref:hypothetical protein n=1 Tax=Actinokineospora sp. NBRC 105648 TaxID=3032206 RepID=UPI0024A1DC3F|nr:hypothetical protein [Actinokineospora sp. NBRC 105648]GLZ38410.1 hypothetical protein Acsp05_20340 [Actinokineospora sp. NBRC 105648]